jgi:hypothetical protein
VTDPHELRNKFSLLSGEQKASLHAELQAVKSCDGATSCRAAEQAKRPADRR